MRTEEFGYILEQQMKLDEPCEKKRNILTIAVECIVKYKGEETCKKEYNSGIKRKSGRKKLKMTDHIKRRG